MSILQSRARKTRGFTLTEAAIVLGIVGLILGAIWVAAAAVYENMRTNRANEQILKVAQAVRSLYASSPTMGIASPADPSEDLTDSLLAAGIFPSDMINGTTVYNPWDTTGGTAGHTVHVMGTDSTPPRFAIRFNAVPKAACIRLVTANTGQQRDAGMYAVGTDAAAEIKKASVDGDFPVSVIDAENDVCVADNPGVALVFKLKP